MQPNDFRNLLILYFDDFKKALATDKGDWVVKGFIPKFHIPTLKNISIGEMFNDDYKEKDSHENGGRVFQ